MRNCCPRARLALRFCRGFALIRVRSLRSCRGAYPRFTPAVCLATNRTACDTLRSYSAGSRSPFARSRGVGAVICLGGFTSGLAVSLWRSRRVTGERVTGLAARRLCAFAQSYWPCNAFRGEYAGAARPRLRQRVKSGSRTAASLDSLHAAAGLGWCVFAANLRQRVKSGSGTAASQDSLHLIRGVGA